MCRAECGRKKYIYGQNKGKVKGKDKFNEVTCHEDAYIT
jgi:hypothetical protein